MEVVKVILFVIDHLLFFILAVSVLYLFVFAIASKKKRKFQYPEAKKKHRFAVLYPAYKEDKVIEMAAGSFLAQNYPKELYDVVVISDQMKEETNERLVEQGFILLKANYKDSSKAKALQLAMNSLDETKYDAVVIMDGDNLVEENFLEEVNKVFDSGCIAIQTHRRAKSRKTTTAVLDTDTQNGEKQKNDYSRTGCSERRNQQLHFQRRTCKLRFIRRSHRFRDDF